MNPGKAAPAALAEGLKAAPEGPLGVAVSGGSDSTALLCLMADWAKDQGRTLLAATVDHRLRPESRAEAEAVGDTCRALGIEHDVLTWTNPTGIGNLQDRARTARRDLLANWAAAKGINGIALGHTLDDQAETVFLRLARGSGVDGLGGMQAVRHSQGLIWLRPLLTITRADLRQMLRTRSIGWHDDPSNDDPRFARIRVRGLMPSLAAEGIDAATLSATADRMRMAREVLDDAARALADTAATVSELGYIRLRLPPWRAARRETRLRVLAASLNWVGGQTYRPRLADLSRIEEALLAGSPDARTLHGCILRATEDDMTICREPAATGPVAPAGEVWDGRWTSSGTKGAQVRALGEAGLSARPDWRGTGHPRDALLASAAIWRGTDLLATAWDTEDAANRLELALPLQLCFTNS